MEQKLLEYVKKWKLKECLLIVEIAPVLVL